MIIKKYQGKNESEATELAKKELGESVVIMNVRTFKPKGLKGFFQGSKVEVTVALEEESERPQPKPPTMTALSGLFWFNLNYLGSFYRILSHLFLPLSQEALRRQG